MQTFLSVFIVIFSICLKGCISFPLGTSEDRRCSSVGEAGKTTAYGQSGADLKISGLYHHCKVGIPLQHTGCLLEQRKAKQTTVLLPHSLRSEVTNPFTTIIYYLSVPGFLHEYIHKY